MGGEPGARQITGGGKEKELLAGPQQSDQGGEGRENALGLIKPCFGRLTPTSPPSRSAGRHTEGVLEKLGEGGVAVRDVLPLVGEGVDHQPGAGVGGVEGRGDGLEIVWSAAMEKMRKLWRTMRTNTMMRKCAKNADCIMSPSSQLC